MFDGQAAVRPVIERSRVMSLAVVLCVLSRLWIQEVGCATRLRRLTNTNSADVMGVEIGHQHESMADDGLREQRLPSTHSSGCAWQRHPIRDTDDFGFGWCPMPFEHRQRRNRLPLRIDSAQPRPMLDVMLGIALPACA